MTVFDKITDAWLAWFDSGQQFPEYMEAKLLYVKNFNFPCFEYPPFHRWKTFENRKDSIAFQKVYDVLNKRPKRPRSRVMKESDTTGHDISIFDVKDSNGIVMTTKRVEFPQKYRTDDIMLAMCFENSDWKCSITHTQLDYSKPITMYDDIMFVQGNIDKFEEDMITLLLTC